MRLSWQERTLRIAAFGIAAFGIVLPKGLAAEQGEPQRGKVLYQYGCQVCHGNEGRGDGPAAKNFDPSPQDLTDARYVQGLSDDHLFRVIKLGGGPFGKPNMPAWGGLLKDEEIRDLVAYLRTLVTK